MWESLYTLTLQRPGPLLFPSISLFLPLGFRLLLAVPDHCMLHTQAFRGSASSVLPGEREITFFLGEVTVKRKPSSLQFGSF